MSRLPKELVFLIPLIVFLPLQMVHAGIHYYVLDNAGQTKIVKWREAQITVEINASTSTALTNIEVDAEIQAALTEWEQVPDSSIHFLKKTTTISPDEFTSEPDFRNFISFTAGNFNPGVIAITFVTSDIDEKVIVDADIQFNRSEYTFITQANGPSNLDGNLVVLRSVATHELGHLLGFDHSPIREQSIGIFSIPESTLFPFFSDRQNSLEQDDKSILSFTYPQASNGFTGVIEGFIRSGDRALDGVVGAHVLAWDRTTNPATVISSISGLSSTGVNLDGFYRIEGLPSGNYSAFIEPFPILSDSSFVNLEKDFDFLNQVPASLKTFFLVKAGNFPAEYWHDQSESQYEIESGFDSAPLILINNLPENQKKQADFITNLSQPLLNLSQSVFESDQPILYANGLSNTRLRLIVRDNIGTTIEADLSSRLELRTTTGSFSSTSVLTRSAPVFQNDGSFSYLLNLFSIKLRGSDSNHVAKINVHLDQGVQGVFFTDLEVRFERVDPAKTEVQFIPDIVTFSENALEQNKGDIFANGTSPATWRLKPMFSNGKLISDALDLSEQVSFILAANPESSITTFPMVSLGDNLYQTTMTNSLPGIVKPLFVLDGILLEEQSSVRFSSISSSQSDFRITPSTLHIQHPQISDPSKATIIIEPALEDGSRVPSAILTTSFNIVFRNNLGLSANPTLSAVQGPLRDSAGLNFYSVDVEASANIQTLEVELDIGAQRLTRKRTLNFSVSDPSQTEVKSALGFLLANSNQTSEVQVLPRFSDGSLVNSDLSSLVFLNTNLGFIRNSIGETTSSSTLSIHPSHAGNGVLTASFQPGTLLGTALISGKIFSQGFNNIQNQAVIQIVTGSPNLLSVVLQSESLPADGQSITTVTLTPLFPDGSPIGKEFPESRLTATLSEGEFLKKSFSPLNPSQVILESAGREQVSFFNNGDGRFELSIRSTSFSTLSALNFYMDQVLSLISRSLVFTVAGSADPDRTLIKVDPLVIFADGKSTARVDIFPKAASGERLSLPTSTRVVVQTSLGLLIGSLVRNSDASYSQWIQSEQTSSRKTAEITVFIDDIAMNPNPSLKLKFVNLDVSKLSTRQVFPDRNLIDGFDIAILAQNIRSQICQNGLGDCSFDFNGDGNINELDLEILEDAYGKKSTN
jgi:hypothetical protein